MVGLVKLMGIVMLVAGVVYFVKPLTMKKLANYFAKEPHLKVGGVVSIIIGLIFLHAAGRCSVSWLVVLLGLLSTVKGIVILTLEKKKVDIVFDWLNKKSPKALRKLSLITIAMGVGLIYAA